MKSSGYYNIIAEIIKKQNHCNWAQNHPPFQLLESRQHKWYRKKHAVLIAKKVSLPILRVKL